MTTTETRIGKYEAMFLFPQAASADMNGAMDHIKEVLSPRARPRCTAW